MARAVQHVYILKNIIHDWDDQRASDMLSTCRRYMPNHARLLLVEREMPELVASGVSIEAFLTDLEMRVMSPDGASAPKRNFASCWATQELRYGA